MQVVVFLLQIILIRILVLVVALFWAVFVGAQTRAVVNNAIPSDNMLRYYRLALPVTLSAFEEDFAEEFLLIFERFRCFFSGAQGV